MPATSLGGSKYVMTCVDDLPRFKIVRFLKKKSNATAALRNVIAEYITPVGLKIGSIRTDEGGEFEGEFQQVLDSHDNHEFTPPDTPQYNRVAERALGLLREKSIAMLQEITVAASGRLWTEALNYACDVSNMSFTSSLEGGTSQYEKLYDRKPSLQHLKQPFGTVGYTRKGKRAHKLAPRGKQRVMLGIAHNHPRDTVNVLVVQKRKIAHRQNISWHPEVRPWWTRFTHSGGGQ